MVDDKNDALSRLLELKKERFNELAADIELTEDEAKGFTLNSEQELDVAISTLKLMKARRNSNLDEEASEKPAFFIPKVADKAKLNAKAAKTKKDDNDDDDEKRFNTLSVFSPAHAATTPGMRINEEATVIRLYAGPGDRIGRLL